MIEGIMVTLTGNELKKLCNGHAAHHRKRAKVYADQIKSNPLRVGFARTP
jgi:hypothetical protein